MNILVSIVMAAALILSVSCSRSVRYSQDEIKDYSPEIQTKIKNREITPGMNKLQVRYSWGGPKTVTVLPPAESGKERVEWTYEKIGLFKTRLIFVDGILAEIISSEPGVSK